MLAQLVRYGKLCANHRPGKPCNESARIECPGCCERGCDYCNQQGRIDLEGCPSASVPLIAWEVIESADYLRQGVLPVAGGLLDQCKWWALAARYAQSVEDRIKNELPQ